MSDQKARKARLKAHLNKLKTEPAISSGQIRDILKDVLEELTHEDDKTLDGGTF